MTADNDRECEWCRDVEPCPEAHPQIRLYRVTLPICNLCMQGLGEECHVPGCAFWMHAVPKLADWMVERAELIRNDHDGGEDAVSCQVCGEVYATLEALERHFDNEGHGL